MPRKPVITDLDYWIYHPTLTQWIGPYFKVATARKYAKEIARTTGKTVEVYAEKAGTGVRKALDKLRAK